MGETRADLIAEMEHFRRAMARPHGMSLLGTVLAEEHETPELLEAFRAYLVVPRRRALHAILEAAQARGELRPDADLALAVNMLVGAFYAQYLAAQPLADDWSKKVVDALLAGCSRPSGNDKEPQRGHPDLSIPSSLNSG